MLVWCGVVVDDELKLAAKKIVRAIHIKRYDPAGISNPALQRHYAIIQAMALHEPPPTDDEVHTQLTPSHILSTLQRTVNPPLLHTRAHISHTVAAAVGGHS